MVILIMVAPIIVVAIMVILIIITITNTRIRGTLGILRIGTPVIDYSSLIKIKDLPDLHIKLIQKTLINPIIPIV
jgi:hypothetical protein